MQQEQAALVDTLQQMMLSAESQHQPELAYNSRLLLQLISSLTVAGRLDAPLDPDWVRIRPELNPPLAGNYRLWLARRRQWFSSMGWSVGLMSCYCVPAKVLTPI